MLVDNPEIYHGLNYPWGVGVNPTPGQPEKIADGVYWVRFAMPMSLDHINIWLLEEEAGWTVVDTCLDIPDAKAVWEDLFSGFMQGKPVLRVIATHMHPDHVGLAGWICRKFDCSLWMSREEYLMCRMMAADTGRAAPQAGIDFYRAAGYQPAQLERYKQRFGEFGAAISALPDNFRRLIDGETLQINGRYWVVVVGSGHSPEHVALFCPALKLLISGDQILPKITSNVSVFPTEPEGNPLKVWLRSNGRIRDILPDDVLVLPSHEAPFYGLHTRLTHMLEGHKRDLNKLFDFLSEPRRAVDCFPVLFKRTIDDTVLGMATGEALAHLNCLLGRRQIVRQRDPQGVDWYQQRPETADIE
jgi:glyoxylase-like metal-dependent hydrolase (beta-lactamase superfamily II)